MTRKIVVLEGDGIGPPIVDATLKLLDALDCGFEYVEAWAGQTALDKDEDLIPQKTLDLIDEHKIALKGPITTPVGQGFTSVNVQLRKHFKLYANVRPVVSFEGAKSLYKNIDIITVRENTEGMYSGEGQKMMEHGERAEAMSVVTHEESERVIRFAFDLARRLGRKKVTCTHKANILKTTSGLFLKTAREVAEDYDDIEFNDIIVDAACMRLVMNPQAFDVIVATNLFGDIISDLCAGLVGGLGLAPGANIGEDHALFEAVHGSAPDIAGQNIANPSAMMLAAAMMLDHLDMNDKAQQIRKAIHGAVADHDRVTPDLDGDGTTTSYTEAVLERL